MIRQQLDSVLKTYKRYIQDHRCLITSGGKEYGMATHGTLPPLVVACRKTMLERFYFLIGWHDFLICLKKFFKTEEASYIFQELIDKFDPTVKLLNNLAVCKVHMEQYPEAEEMLTTALEENPGDVDSLVNLIVVSRHLNKSQEVIDNLMEQIKQKDPNNLKLKEWLEAEAIFDENVGNFK